MCKLVLKLYIDDCSTHKCPTGSQCKVCNETDSPYCVYSCAVDNGGCGEGRLCTTVDVSSCKDGECCSPVDVTCPGNVEQLEHT